MRASFRLSQASTLSSEPKDFHLESDARLLTPTPLSKGSQITGSSVFDPLLSSTVRVGAQGGAIKYQRPAKAAAGETMKRIKTASVAKIAALIGSLRAGPRCRGGRRTRSRIGTRRRGIGLPCRVFSCQGLAA